MPVIYVPKELYDELVRLGEDPSRFVIAVAQERLEAIKKMIRGPLKGEGDEGK